MRGEVKKLRAENIRLKRNNKHFERRNHFFENVIEDVAEEITVTEGCESCGKGQLIELDLGRLLIKKCDVCECKTVIKKKN